MTPTLVATPTPTPTPTPTGPDLVVGTEALIAGVPNPDDGWRVLVDSVVHGSAALAGGQPTLPELPKGEWLRLRFRVRYVGTGTPSQRLLAQDMSVLFQKDGLNYETKPVGASPALDTDIAKDADVSVTFWFSIAESAPVINLVWDAFGQPPLTYQWDLTAPAASTAPPQEWTTPTVQKWKTLSGPVSWFPDFRSEVLANPPGQFLVADWSMKQPGSVGCEFSVDFENGAGSIGISDDSTALRGTSLVKLPGLTGVGSGGLNTTFLITCPWRLDLAGIGSLFGPDSESVADFIWRAGNLGPSWVGINAGPVPSNVVAAVDRALAIAAADPHAHAALGNALDPKWYRGNRYLEEPANAGHLLAWSDAILALVLRSRIDPSDFDLLYQPFAADIPSEILGSTAP